MRQGDGEQEPGRGQPVLVGWLVTLPGGHECRLGPDKARADHYAAQQHGTIEAMFVWREAGRQIAPGGTIGSPAMAGQRGG
jgi:hypothetical protein